MSERLADISARIDGVQKLGSVVNAMRGIAATRSRQAQAALVAVDSYAETIRRGIGRVLPMVPAQEVTRPGRPPRRAIVVFLAEEGFVGNFSGRILDALDEQRPAQELLLVGTRGVAFARERALRARWQGAMPSRIQSVPKLADQIAAAVYTGIAGGSIEALDVLHATVQSGSVAVVCQSLLPFDPTGIHGEAMRPQPMLQLPPRALLAQLAGEYLHAQLCQAAFHAFAAENQARMQAMAGTRGQVERMLDDLQVKQRIVRQEEITAEIIELAAGERANRDVSN